MKRPEVVSVLRCRHAMKCCDGLINVKLGGSFHHRRGVLQGDPLAPMLFILAIDHLAKIIDCAIQEDILSPIPSCTIRMRTSLYAGDVAIFMNPIKTEIQAIQQIL